MNIEPADEGILLSYYTYEYEGTSPHSRKILVKVIHREIKAEIEEQQIIRK